MNKKHLFFLLHILLQLLSLSLVAQIPMPSYTLNSQDSGNKSYLARDFISLKSGFSYKAVADESFSAKVNQCILFPPTDATFQKSDGSGSSNPSDGGVVGAINGQFDVSPSGGSTYGIPIEIPVGINGMQPNISLVYSSQSGNGIAGWGWNIGGISSISRVGSNIYNDSKIRGIQLTNEDNLSLDGQRLILISGGNLLEGSKYRTEQENYSDITLATVNGYLSFEVKTKAGITLYYGRSSDSFIEASGSSTGLVWLLTKTIDANGNYMTYSYNEDNTNGEFSLSKINYTGNDNAGTAPTNEISFVYTTREDIITSYISTAKTSQSVVLKSIISKTSGQTLREYGLEYLTDGFYTKLSKLTLKGADGTTYNPTIIDWAKLGSTGAPITSISKTVSADLKSGCTLDNSAIIIDINNDGYSDFIKPLLDPMLYVYHAWEVSISANNGKNFTTTTTEWDNPNDNTSYAFRGTYKLIPADINKDGITDLVEVRASHGNYDVPTEYYVDILFTNNGALTRQKLDFIIDNSIDSRNLNFSVADYDGDGNVEFLAISASKITMYRFDLVAATKTLTVVSITDISMQGFNGFLITDINGNGKPELFSATDGTSCEYDNADSKFKVLAIKDDLFSPDKNYLVADFNGDGETDILIYDELQSKWYTKLSTGKAFVDITCPLTRKKTYDTSEHYSVNDYNGDGKADILEIYSDPYNNKYVVNVYYSNGTKFIKATHSIDDNSGVFYANREVPFADINGDGKCDLVAIGYSNANIYSFSTPETERRVTSITNGLKQKTEITYKPISDNTIYTAGASDAKNNIRDICIPLQVVSEVNTGNSALTINTKYSYKGLKIHTRGKGILGFEEFTTKNITQGFTKVSKYGYNSTYFNTFPVEQIVTLTDGRAVSNTKVVNTTISLGNNRIFTYTSKQTDLGNLTGLSTVTEISDIDGYGNPQTIKITKGVVNQSKSIKYGAYGAWCANKPTNIIITNSNEEGSEARTTNYEYDSNGNVTKEVVDPSNVNESTTNYTNYDKFGNPQLIKTTANSKSLSTTLKYSPSGRFVVSKTNNELGKTETYTYNEALGLKTSSTNEIGTSTFEYDGFGRIKHVVSADKTESVSTLQWSTSVTGAIFYKYEATSGSSPMTTWYDALGREIRSDSYSLNGKMISVTTEYDNTGKLSKVSEPFFGGGSATNKKEYTYDDYARLKGLTTIFGSTSYVYNGFNATITAPSETTITIINSAGQTTSTSINGKKVSYTYWPSGNVKSATPEGGNAITTTYNLQGNRTEMVDPDNGIISSNYNGIGQLLWEEQRKSSNLPVISRTDYTYLDNGLLDNKKITGSSSEVTQYQYDSRSRVTSVEIANSHKQAFAYDNLNRVTQTTETIGTNKSFTSQTIYDGFGRVVQEVFPSGYSTINGFDKFGFLVKVSDTNGKIIWEAKEANERGQLTKVLQGGRESTIDYDAKGLPLSITSPNILSMAYLFNAKGNLEKRTDNLTAQSENFGYDNLNRLTTWSVAKNGTVVNNSISYDPTLGNITAKSDIGYTMNYGESGQPKHALTSIGGVPVNLVGSSNQKTSFTNFNKVSVIGQGADTLSVYYGVGQQRIKGVFKTNNTTTLTRYYHGNYEEEVSPSGNIRKIHYIHGGNGLAAIFVQNGGKDSLYYTYTDYQGNLLAVTNEAGTVLQKLAYDPWGARRNPDDWTQRDNRKSFIFARGYTMHEHLDQFGLINMNGRIYDPLLTMFLSPDKFIQSPNNVLNYNKYSYCINNPLKYVDLDGNRYTDPWGLFTYNVAVKPHGVLDHKTWRNNIFGFTFPGGSNPKDKWGKDYYDDEDGCGSFTHGMRPSDFPGLQHDQEYDKMGVSNGAVALFVNPRVAIYDKVFVAQSGIISFELLVNGNLRESSEALTIGMGLDMISTPKMETSFMACYYETYGVNSFLDKSNLNQTQKNGLKFQNYALMAPNYGIAVALASTVASMVVAFGSPALIASATTSYALKYGELAHKALKQAGYFTPSNIARGLLTGFGW